MNDGQNTYEDDVVVVDDTGLTIKRYGVTGSSRRIEFDDINSVEAFEMGRLSGKWRLVGIGPGRPRNWFSWDRDRGHKRQALSIDVGKWIKPALTPDDVVSVEGLIRSGTASS